MEEPGDPDLTGKPHSGMSLVLRIFARPGGGFPLRPWQSTAEPVTAMSSTFGRAFSAPRWGKPALSPAPNGSADAVKFLVINSWRD